jgi:transcriptional regulator with XRE-family HTH domain
MMTRKPGATLTRKKPKPKRHAECAYELPTEEKKAFGKRMETARTISGLTLTQAAEAMGYSQPVQLSLMESGKRMATLRIIIECAKLYGTTADYLCGLAEDSDRDPVAAIQRHVAARVASEVNTMVRRMSDVSVQAVRELMPAAAEGQRVAELVKELNFAMARFVQANPTFEDMPKGSAVVSKMHLAASAAVVYIERVERTKRLLAARIGRECEDDATRPQMSLLPVLDMSVAG